MEKIRITKETRNVDLVPNILYEIIETPHTYGNDKYYYTKTYKVNSESKEKALRQLKTEFEKYSEKKIITEEVINLILKDDRTCYDFCDNDYFNEVGITHKLENGYTAWISFVE